METISGCALTYLLNSLWQIPLVAAIAALASRLLRHAPAAYRQAIWTAALAAAVLLPAASIQRGEPAEPSRYTVAYAPQTLAIAPPASMPSAEPGRPVSASNTRIVSLAQTTGMALLGIYALTLLFGSGKLAWTWVRTVQLRRSAEIRTAPPLVAEIWARSKAALGLTEVELLWSAEVSCPVAAGVWRGVIILPECLFTEASEEVLASAIGHEMAHIARRDFPQKLLCEVLYLPAWFHPATWLIRRGMERAREMACDELVTRRLLEPEVYARSILSIAAMCQRSSPGYALGVFDGDILEERIRRLVERRAVNWKRARVLLASGLSAMALCVAIGSGVAFSARAQGGSPNEMKLAAAAYNSRDFKTAVEHFKKAVESEPANVNAKLFLANALLCERLAEKEKADGPLLASARQQYRDVLARAPRSKQAMEGMLAVSMDASRLSEAYDWALKLIQLDPKDKTAYYAAGLLEWTLVYPELQRAREAAGLKTSDSLIPDAAVRKNLRERFLPRIEDGLKMLRKALELDPEYSDAMAYLNLLTRLKAGIVEDPAESADLISKADKLLQKAQFARQRQKQSLQTAPAQLDIDGPAPGPARAQALVMAPPPPPPPPK